MASRIAQTEMAGLFPHTEALTGPVDEAAVDTLRAAASAEERRYFLAERARIVAGVVLSIMVILAIVFGLVVSPFLLAAFAMNVTLGTVLGGSLFATVGVFVAGFFGRSRLRAVRSRLIALGSWTRRWRLTAFAEANGIRYAARPPRLPLLGSILSQGRARYSDTFWIGGEHPIILGNAATTTTAVSSHAPHGWFFIGFKLEARVPHMVVMPRARKLAALGQPLFQLAGGQRLHLEGDWDRHFSLYVPGDYERDALYLLTPDLMGLLIDHLPGAYIETFDDTVVITAPGLMDFTDPDAWSHLAQVIDAVLPKTHRQTRNYRDDRSRTHGHVAPQGRQLRPAIPVLSVISGLVAAAQIAIWLSRLS